MRIVSMEKLPDTIEACHEIIRVLFSSLNEAAKRIEALEQEVRELKERLNNNSSNSSLPPSKDFKKKKKNNKSSSGKPSGGQPGHKGHYRDLLESDEVYELPVLKLHVTEYQLQKGCCDSCHQKQIACLPEGITWGITGPRLTSFMSELVTKYGVSRREQKRFLSEHFSFHISLGTVFNK